VTEQNGQNPEVMQELPPENVGSEPEYAPTEHEEHPAEHEVHAEEPEVSEDAAAGGDYGDDDGGESIVAVPVKPKPVKSEGPRTRKAAAVEAPVATDVPKSESMNWYILKVQSNREESIREGLLRRVAIQGLDRFFGEVIVPTEKVTEFKGGKKRVIKRKLYPGYLVVHMEINEDTWFLVRETPGIGDFTGASGIPTPMLPHEVERIVMKQEEKSEKAPDLKIPFTKGDRVKVIEGNFENFEGEVENIDKTNGRVTVMITIFNRTTPVEFEYWQVESL
jgi:transcriptional antiterminator NusG